MELGTPNEFKYGLGDEVKETITGFKGIVRCRTQWLSNCNTYGLQSAKLNKDGEPADLVSFDEPRLKLVKAGKIADSKKT